VLNLITTALELAGAALVLVALALVAHAVTPEPFSLAAALGVVGLGLIALSFVVAPRRIRRKAATR
jgi:hypothetical protein